jgi:hypothetical protein
VGCPEAKEKPPGAGNGVGSRGHLAGLSPQPLGTDNLSSGIRGRPASRHCRTDCLLADAVKACCKGSGRENDWCCILRPPHPQSTGAGPYCPQQHARPTGTSQALLDMTKRKQILLSHGLMTWTCSSIPYTSSYMTVSFFISKMKQIGPESVAQWVEHLNSTSKGLWVPFYCKK